MSNASLNLGFLGLPVKAQFFFSISENVFSLKNKKSNSLRKNSQQIYELSAVVMSRQINRPKMLEKVKTSGCFFYSFVVAENLVAAGINQQL